MLALRWFALGLLCGCVPPPLPTPDAGGTSDAGLDAGVDAGMDRVLAITALRTSAAGRVDWCQDPGRDLIAYDSVTAGAWSIHTMSADGGDDRCLTCVPVPGLPANTDLGQPAFSPDCEWLVVQVHSQTLADGLIPPRFFGPGWGLHSDLYLLKTDGTHAVRVLQLTDPQTASLHPQFSADGRFLFWTARDPVGAPADANFPWAGWYLSIAQIDLTVATPSLGARVDFYRTAPASARGFFESHALKGPVMWFSRTLAGARLVDEGFSASVMAPDALTNWTNSPGTWEEHTMPSPGFALVTFNSSQASSWHNPPDEDFPELSTELWARVVDGGALLQLTHFNDQLTAAELAQGVTSVTSDYSWAPSGDRVAVYSVKNRNGVIVNQRIDVLTLDRSY